MCLKEMPMSFDMERELYIKKLNNIVDGIEKINNIENSRIISNETRVELNKNKDNASKLLKKLEKGEFEIAVIGLEKAGKSSFSNAIMDNDVLPTADARCTYTATCIKAGEVDHAIVTFFSVEEFNKEFRDKFILKRRVNAKVILCRKCCVAWAIFNDCLCC